MASILAGPKWLPGWWIRAAESRTRRVSHGWRRGCGDRVRRRGRNAMEAIFSAVPEARGAVTGIGLCAPGPLDPERASCSIRQTCRAGAASRWRPKPVSAFGVPAKVDNDANAAGLAEVLWGAAAGYSNVFYPPWEPVSARESCWTARSITGVPAAPPRAGTSPSTNGVRGAAAASRAASKPWPPGRRSRACTGQTGAGQARPASSNWRADWSRFGPSMWARRSAKATWLARQVLEETAILLAVWLGNIVDLLNRNDRGGRRSRGDDGPVLRGISNRLPRWAINQRAAENPLVMARYGADAGIAGAAALCG